MLKRFIAVVAVVDVLVTGCVGPAPFTPPAHPSTSPPILTASPATSEPSVTSSCKEACPGSPSVSNSVSTTDHGVPALADVKDALIRRATFEEMQSKYALEIFETTQEGIGAASATAPRVQWGFAEGEGEPGVLRMDGIAGPASFILPEYSGMSLEDIPIVTWVASDGKEVDLAEGIFGYYAFLDDTPGVLAADATVTMGVN